MPGLEWAETLWHDLRYAWRTLRRNPGFTMVALLSLALGIGANTAIFSVMDALLLKMIPVKNPEQMVMGRSQLSFPAFQKIRDRNQVFDGMFAIGFLIPASVRIGEEAEQATGQMVSADYFPTVGVGAALGRVFTRGDDQIPGVGGSQGPVAVISDTYWKRRFDRDPAVLGKVITLNGVAVTIIGVTPPGFFGTIPTLAPEITVPIALQPRISPSPSTELWTHGDEGSFLSYDQTDNYGPPFMARLKPNVTRAQAQAELNVLYQGILAARAGTTIDERKGRENLEKKMELVASGNGSAGWDPATRALLLIVMVAIPGLVLLIACANVANLLLARAASREKEVAVRLAIGAGRWRLVRQLFTESALLSLAGGVLGLAVASVGRRLLVAWLSTRLDFPLFLPAENDARALAFTLAASLAAAILFGLAPAFRATRTELASTLKEGGRASAGGRGWEAGKVLVGAQVALSLLRLICAGLLIRSVQNMRFFDPGFKRENLYLISTNFLGYKGPRTGALLKEIWDRMNSLPGALATGIAQDIPPFDRRLRVTVEGYTPPSEKEMYVDRMLVGPGFFDAMGIPVLSGRALGARDDENAPKVCVVSAGMARTFFAETNPLGRHFRFERTGAEYTVEIVGVVKDLKKADSKEKVWRAVYCPMLQDLPSAQSTLLVRVAGDPAAAIAEARRQFSLIDKNLFLTIKTMERLVDDNLLLQRFFVLLCASFGLLALLLASAGLYGVMAYSVARRTNEIGIRMALGADRRTVVVMVLRETMKLVAVGMAVGLAAAWAATRLLSAALFGVKPTDPLTIFTCVMVMALVALVAGYAPSVRAAGVDPMTALRHE